MMSFGIAILFAYLLFHLSRNRWIGSILSLVGLCYTFTIGFSRIYVSVHYLGDVLGGYLAAISVTYPLIAFYEFLIKYTTLIKKRGSQ